MKKRNFSYNYKPWLGISVYVYICVHMYVCIWMCRHVWLFMNIRRKSENPPMKYMRVCTCARTHTHTHRLMENKKDPILFKFTWKCLYLFHWIKISHRFLIYIYIYIYMKSIFSYLAHTVHIFLSWSVLIYQIVFLSIHLILFKHISPSIFNIYIYIY